MTERTHPWRLAIIGFDHMHAGDFIRNILAHPRAQVAGTWDSDPDRMAAVAADFGLSAELQFADVDDLVAAADLEIAVICSTTRDHARWVEYFAARGVDVIVEKPFATSLAEADRMILAAERAGITLAVNWPLAWYPPHRTTHRLIEEGLIGAVTEVHYYDGNRGPLHHLHDKISIDGTSDRTAMRESWWYQAAAGGGSLLDYLGYGATLSTWFRNGELPSRITAMTHVVPGDEVDEQSVVIAAFPQGLSTLQTRWGTFTDPWTNQPQPRCGFVVVGTDGTIASFDYADHVSVQTREHPEGVRIPVDVLAPEDRNGIAHVIDVLENGRSLTGPLSWRIARSGQRIVDSAIASAAAQATIGLLGTQDPE